MIEALDRLREDGAASGRLFFLNLHPWIIGQPFRKQVPEARTQAHRAAHGVWIATENEIVDSYLKHTAPESDLRDASGSEREMQP